jgi:hypothetical protein
MSDIAGTPGRRAFPVRVDATLDPSLSRGLWLVKWLLLIPHFVVLAFLWPAFVVLTLAAFVSILVTGRYPRALFDFNVGVLRWSWRVHYYGYGALGTDRYPPFTLADVPDYPAHLEIAYPERLSRGLVLVKSWLLAVPHYLVLALFVGGGAWFATTPRNSGWNDGWAAGGLVGLLVLVAGVVLLFRGRYPAGLYDFVLGMDRWALRVAAYAALMTDRYPPFRFDAGGPEPGSAPAPPPVPGPGGTGRAAPSGWTAGRVISAVVGALLLFTSTGLLAGGAGLLWADRTQRDSGYLSMPTMQMSTSGYALTADGLRIEGSASDWMLDRAVGTVRLEVRPTGGADLFVGIAPTTAVHRYLTGVPYTRMGMLGGGVTGMGPAMMTGGAPAVAPQDTGIWTTQSSGPGPRVLRWHPSRGDWSLVVMRLDRGAAVAADVRAAATVPATPWIAAGLLTAGTLLLASGGALVGVAARRAGRGAHPPLPPAAGTGSGGQERALAAPGPR